MKLRMRYLGPYFEAEVVGLGRVKRGEVYDIDEELATNLSTASWERADKHGKAPVSKPFSPKPIRRVK